MTKKLKEKLSADGMTNGQRRLYSLELLKGARVVEVSADEYRVTKCGQDIIYRRRVAGWDVRAEVIFDGRIFDDSASGALVKLFWAELNSAAWLAQDEAYTASKKKAAEFFGI